MNQPASSHRSGRLCSERAQTLPFIMIELADGTRSLSPHTAFTVPRSHICQPDFTHRTLCRFAVRSRRGGARQGGPIRNLLHILYIYVNTLAYNGAQTTMVASGDRVSHVNGWSFHSDLPELTRDANVDSAQLLPSGGARRWLAYWFFSAHVGP